MPVVRRTGDNSWRSDEHMFGEGLVVNPAEQVYRIDGGETVAHSMWVAEEQNPGMTDFLALIGDALGAVMRTSKPVAAAVKGHAIAGGFVMAAACDYVALQKPRQGEPEYLVGVTEVKVGVAFPRVPFEICRHHLAGETRGLRELVYQGTLSSPLGLPVIRLL